MSTTKAINIVALLSKEQLSRGKYVISIDVVGKKDADSIIKKRLKEGYVVDPCLMHSAKSSVQEIKIPKDGIATIKFEITGALKPLKALVSGQDELRYTGKEECHRTIVLVPNPDDSSATGEITFSLVSSKTETVFLHQVSIDDVPKPSTMPASTSSTSLEFAIGAISITGAIDKNISNGAVGENVLTSSGPAQSSVQQQAVPLPPRPTSSTTKPSAKVKALQAEPAPRHYSPGPAPRGDSPGPDDSPSMVDGSDYLDNVGHGPIMKNSSIEAIASALTPQNANRLVIGLGVKNSIVQQLQKDHHLDCVTATYQLLVHWRNNSKLGTEKMFNVLLKELSDIERNDMVCVIRKRGDAGEGLCRKDFDLYE